MKTTQQKLEKIIKEEIKNFRLEIEMLFEGGEEDKIQVGPLIFDADFWSRITSPHTWAMPSEEEQRKKEKQERIRRANPLFPGFRVGEKEKRILNQLELFNPRIAAALKKSLNIVDPGFERRNKMKKIKQLSPKAYKALKNVEKSLDHVFHPPRYKGSGVRDQLIPTFHQVTMEETQKPQFLVYEGESTGEHPGLTKLFRNLFGDTVAGAFDWMTTTHQVGPIRIRPDLGVTAMDPMVRRLEKARARRRINPAAAKARKAKKDKYARDLEKLTIMNPKVAEFINKLESRITSGELFRTKPKPPWLKNLKNFGLKTLLPFKE